MKNRFMTLAGWLVMAAALTTGLAACAGSDDNIEQNTPDIPTNPTTPKNYTLTVTATKGGDATRALGLSSDGMTLNAWWKAGETVEVENFGDFFTSDPVKLGGKLTAQNTGGVGDDVTLSGQLTGNIAVNDRLYLNYPQTDIYYTGQDGTLETISERYDYASAQVTVTAIDPQTGALTINDNNGGDNVATFKNQQSIVRFRLMKNDGTTPVAAKNLTISAKYGSNERIITGTDAEGNYVTGPLAIIVPDDPDDPNDGSASEIYAAIKTNVSVATDISLTANDADSKAWTYSRSNVQFTEGQFYSITVKMSELEATRTITTTDEEVTLNNGDVVSGEGGSNTVLKIAEGATVTLYNLTNNSITKNDDVAGIECKGDATIILAGTNTLKGHWNQAAVYIPRDHTLTIKGEGTLIADNTGGPAGAGIGCTYSKGCGNIIIEGGNIIAKAGFGAGIGGSVGQSCGTITIRGGIVEAMGYFGAGIGCGYNGNCGDITISGSAKVTATGNEGGAGIGSGQGDDEGSSCGAITISGSANVTATGSGNAAGIGSGYASLDYLGGDNIESSCGAITISGSATVTATGGEGGAGIGSGHGDNDGSSCGDIRIEGGTVTAMGSNGGAGIGSGHNGKFTSITITNGITSVEATSVNYDAWPIGKGDGDRSDDVSDSDNPVCAPVIIGGVNINDYYDEDHNFYNGSGRDWSGDGSSLNFYSNGDTWTLTPKTTE